MNTMISPRDWIMRITTVVFAVPLVLIILQDQFWTFALIQVVEGLCILEFRYDICEAISNETKFGEKKSKGTYSRMWDTLFLLFISISSGFTALFELNFDSIRNIANLLLFGYHLLKQVLLQEDPPTSRELLLFCLDILGFNIISCGFIYAILIRQTKHYGLGIQLVGLLCTWNTDNGALIIGSIFGKTKVFPNISPKKTIAGAVGGLIGSILTLLIFYAVIISNWLPQGLLPTISILHQVILGFVIGLLAIIGDIFESYLKRVARMKDSGRIFPGHGGCLDRMDSIFFVMPFLFFWSKFFIQ